MPGSRDPQVKACRALLADYEYELGVRIRRGSSDIEDLTAAAARMRNLIAKLIENLIARQKN
ncbi:MAG: hypothetical protein EON93_01610 [Burkholderiales bacterium]|nr:MAG: hypothetical protein EON93_01610 [Burkholderiales bacterium]